MRPTKLHEIVIPSVINTVLILLLSIPFLLLWGPTLLWKLVAISLMLLYELAFMLFHNDRDLGMVLINTGWAEKYPPWKQLLHNLLYTASFATLFFHVFFPFDLFLFNIFVLQLVSVKMFGATFHAFLSGQMESVKYLKAPSHT